MALSNYTHSITITLGTTPAFSAEELVIATTKGTIRWRFTEPDVPLVPALAYDVNSVQTVNNVAYDMDAVFRSLYNLAGGFGQSLTSNVLVISGEFTALPTVTTNTTSGITVVITTLAVVPKILSVTPSAVVGNECSLVDLTVVTDISVTGLVLPSAAVWSGTSNVISNVARGTTISIQVNDGTTDSAITTYHTPQLLELSNYVLEQYLESGVFTRFTDDGLTVEYSVGIVPYQTSNVFENYTGTGVTAWSIRDEYGCIITGQFTFLETTEETPTTIAEVDPYFYYPKANSIRVAKRVTYNDLEILKNPTNLLSCEEETELVYKGQTFFRSVDSATIQFRSTYDDLVIRTSDDNAIQGFTLKTNYLGLTTMLDAISYQVSAGIIGIYFPGGNTYDYTTELLEGVYDYDGNLPVWAVIGNQIKVGANTYVISDRYYNEDLEFEVIEVKTSLLTIGDILLKSVYNLYPYEVYECTIAMGGRTDFNLEFYFDGVVLQYQSEQITVNDTMDLMLLKYSMSYNTDIIWSSGLIQTMRLEVDKIEAKIINSNEQYDTDMSVIQISSKNKEADKIKFLPLTKEMARVLVLALSHNTLVLNGISYVKDTIEVEPLGRSNLVVVTAELTITNSGLYKDERIVEEQLFPALLNYDGGFLKLR